MSLLTLTILGFALALVLVSLLAYVVVVARRVDVVALDLVGLEVDVERNLSDLRETVRDNILSRVAVERRCDKLDASFRQAGWVWHGPVEAKGGYWSPEQLWAKVDRPAATVGVPGDLGCGCPEEDPTEHGGGW